MRKKTFGSIKTAVIVLLILFLTARVGLFPWWAFIIPVFLTGMLAALLNWKLPAFSIGFWTGFMVWFGLNLYYDQVLPGAVLGRIALLLKVSKFLLVIAAGVAGGLLTGLSLHAGTLFWVNTKEISMTQKT